MSDADAQMRDHNAYDLIEEQFNLELDASLGPSDPDSLFGYVADMTLPSSAVVVDAGCGEGEYAVELASRFGIQVIGVDPVLRCVQAAQRSAPPGCLVKFAVGTSERLPLTSSGAAMSCLWSGTWTARTVSSAAC